MLENASNLMKSVNSIMPESDQVITAKLVLNK